MIIDTNVLLEYPDLPKYEDLIIPMTVLEELDSLKTKRYSAREVLRNILNNEESVTIIDNLKYCQDKCNDNNILREIKEFLDEHDIKDEILYTNDFTMFLKAQSFGVPCKIFKNKDIEFHDPYILNLSDDEVNYLYYDISKIDIPMKDKNRVYPYIICRDSNGNNINTLKYNFEAKEYRILEKFLTLKSSYLGEIKPKDIYQKCLFDSLINDEVTFITGSAGTGKTLLSLAYCMHALEKNEYDKVVIFTNPVKAKDTVDLGFYKGDKYSKLLQNSIGGILSTKFGDIIAIEQLIEQNRMDIQPFSDIRGIEIRSNEILYIPEMQNSSIQLAKLAIQRAQEGAKIIFEGDIDTQVDMLQFENSNNGLRRCIEVLSGYEGISHVHLENIYRSRVAGLAELL